MTEPNKDDRKKAADILWEKQEGWNSRVKWEQAHWGSICFVAVGLAANREALEKSRRRHKEDTERLTAELEKAKTTGPATIDGEDCWQWVGDGSDDPESLSCPVVMTADQVRALVAAAESEPTEDIHAYTCPKHGKSYSPNCMACGQEAMGIESDGDRNV